MAYTLAAKHQDGGYLLESRKKNKDQCILVSRRRHEKILMSTKQLIKIIAVLSASLSSIFSGRPKGKARYLLGLLTSRTSIPSWAHAIQLQKAGINPEFPRIDQISFTSGGSVIWENIGKHNF